MANKILDNSKTMLNIFVNGITIDKTLIKWSSIENDIQAKKKEASSLKSKKTDGVKVANPEQAYGEIVNSIYNDAPKVKEKITDKIREIINMDVRDFNIFIGSESKENMKNTVYTYFDGDSDDINVFNNIISSNDDTTTRIIRPGVIPTTNILSKIKRIFKFTNKGEEMYSFDAIEFFSRVKGLVGESEYTSYIERITPYIVAIKNAETMGQTALLDALLGNIYREKYESLLYANNFYHKISEKQMVDFIKKTEKGISLVYVKNYARPIPVDVMNKKTAADNLMIFDNYVVLHYDPAQKAEVPTAKEKEEERKKKADPILFGVIKGSTDLYYIADWIDEYCDLTLAEFMKVMQVTDSDISITKDIKI